VTVYVYAIVEGSSTNVEGVRTLARHGIAAAFKPVDEPPPATAEEMLAHERVVEDLMRERAVLPARFGTTLADEDALAELLARDGDTFRRLLGRVRGCVELSVRVRGEPARAAELVRPLEGLARDTRLAPGGDSLSAAYLVPVGDVRAFAEEVRRPQQDSDPDLDLSLTGPWPPYSFVGDA
jgi:Gas vesicle synthesis protein GvpL/GvpF